MEEEPAVLTRIHHVGIAVRDADQALGFYHGTLGLPITKDAIIPAQGIRAVLLRAGESELELVQPIRPDTGIARFVESHGEGLHHLCFATDDVQAELDHAKALGLPLIDQQPRPGLAGTVFFLHPRATRGVLVELAQPPADDSTGETDRVGAIGIHHFDRLLVAVADLDASAATYAHNFGLQERAQEELPALGAQRRSLPIGASFIDLIAPITGDSPLASFVDSRGDGLFRIALGVRSLPAATEELGHSGLQFEPSDEQPSNDSVLLSPSQTHGVQIRLIETPPA